MCPACLTSIALIAAIEGLTLAGINGAPDPQHDVITSGGRLAAYRKKDRPLENYRGGQLVRLVDSGAD